MTEHPPVMLYDGDCSFCGRWVARWRNSTGNQIDYQPYQQAVAQYLQIPPDAPAKAVHLIEPDGTIRRGAAAVYRAWALAGHRRWIWWLYQNLPPFAFVSDRVYATVAKHRTAADRVDRLLLGKTTEPICFDLTRQIFLRALAVVYAIAFISLWVQIDGLVGSNGILPIHSYLQRAYAQVGPEAHQLLPTLCWLNDSDSFLHLLCAAGVGAAVLAFAGIVQLPAMVIAFVCYLSLSVAGQDFLEFQWDILLTEAGFLAIFLAPWQWNANAPSRLPLPSRAMLWMLRWLLFRVMFMSGVVKLTSGDPLWRALTALEFHYQTQPLPPWTSWYAQHFAPWFQHFSCAGVFFFELAVPPLIFLPRRPRLLAFWLIAFFQSLIVVTGNYGFFNILTITLCLTLTDDVFWRWIFRLRLPLKPTKSTWLRWPKAITISVCLLLLTATIPEFVGAFHWDVDWPVPVNELRRILGPLRIANGYGLFAVMTTPRNELIVQGSDDGINWKTYEFKWKPCEVNQRPEFVTPHMPRLDWQMWFAALGGPRDSPWLYEFLNSLLKGSPPVLALLETNPFPDHPPQYVRVVLYEYHFSTVEERKATGAWWDRRLIGLFCQVSANEP